MIRIGIVLGSTRPNRNGEQVAKWVYDMASRRSDAEFELVDLRDYPLPPNMDEPPRLGPTGRRGPATVTPVFVCRGITSTSCNPIRPPVPPPSPGLWLGLRAVGCVP